MYELEITDLNTWKLGRYSCATFFPEPGGTLTYTRELCQFPPSCAYQSMQAHAQAIPSSCNMRKQKRTPTSTNPPSHWVVSFSKKRMLALVLSMIRNLARPAGQPASYSQFPSLLHFLSKRTIFCNSLTACSQPDILCQVMLFRVRPPRNFFCEGSLPAWTFGQVVTPRELRLTSSWEFNVGIGAKVKDASCLRTSIMAKHHVPLMLSCVSNTSTELVSQGPT